MRFQDKVAIVTGGASGIGKEVATRFVAEGGSVVINGRDPAKAETAAREIDATGMRVAVQSGDIALPATGEAVVKTAIERFGRLDALFNNAGIFAPKPFLELDEAEYDRFLDVIPQRQVFRGASRREGHESLRPRRRYRADRFDVGAAGNRGDTVGGLFGSKWRRPRHGQEPRDRAGAR
jgi:NAD(P)-dependent dehydrogenase (short-subunit alcohol dehydrogenase family)